jgi:glutamate-1-semialdehyde 2,1-aminomutase
VDGNELIDYFGGHGALLLGHCHPVIVEAVKEQASKGTHYGASHELELQWAELIRDMVPCAEKVRFTSSGTEATQLGFRVARAFTGKNTIVRFAHNFHGWHDQVGYAAVSHYDGSIPAGIPRGLTDNISVCPTNDLDHLRQTLENNTDVAAVILEPTGASFGHVPLPGGDFLAAMKKLTEKHKVLLIFDEVITGFRVAPGGAQEHYGVTPDLALVAKAAAGGFPGGALVGRSDILDVLAIRDDPVWNKEHRVPHQGTFNGNPVAAAAGVAALKLIKSTDACAKANRSAETLRAAMNAVLREQGRNWVVYGDFSAFHIFPNPENRDLNLEDIQSAKVDATVLKATSSSLAFEIRQAFILEGVDMSPWPGGWFSCVHTQEDIEKTTQAFRGVLGRVK